MIIGVFKRDVLVTTIPNIECPNCKKINSLKITVSHEFFNLGLPWFATGKKFHLNCEECKKDFDQSDVPNNLYKKSNEIVQNTRYPKWMFLMLIIAGVTLPFVFFDMYTTRKDNRQKIENPKIGDSYEIKLPTDSYTVFKVVKTSEDSVFFVKSKFETGYEDISNLHQSDESAFSETVEGYSKTELKTMNSQDKITGIEREKE